MIKKILMVVSIVLNVLVLAFLVFSLLHVSPLSFAVFDLPGTSTAACIVSVPSGSFDLVFGPVEFSLPVGTEAALQYSMLVDRQQLNRSLDLLYDRSVVSVTQTGFGVVIRALNPGVTLLQIFTADGVRDVAMVVVEAL